MDKYWLTKENKPAFHHARNQTAHYSKSFYLSARMLPKSQRWATYALYGFCRYADNLIDNPRNRTRSELLAEIEHFTNELKIAYRTGESEHPVIRPFILVAKKYDIPQEYPLDLLRGVRMDIEIDRYADFDMLYTFCYRVAGVVGLMMTHVLGYKTKEAFEYAEKLGIAMQLTNILRDVKEDKERGRIYLPLSELREFGVSESDILNERTTPELQKFMQFQAQRAHDYYKMAAPGIPMLKTESQFAIYSASKIYQGILHKIETQEFNPFLGRVFVPSMEKFGILIQEVVRTKLQVAQERFIPAWQ